MGIHYRYGYDICKEAVMTHFLIRLFVKNSHNTTESKVREAYGQFASIIGILTNVLLVIIKLTAGFLFSSIAIIADGINNLSDTISSLVTLIGFKMSGKPADSEHPYGHARMEYVSGLLVSFFIVFLGLQLFKSSVEEVLNPQVASFSRLTLIILFISVLIKVWQSLFYRKIGLLIDSMTLKAVSVDSRNDVLATTSILIGTGITLLTGYNLDGYMGMMVAAFILYSGFNLVKETVSPLLGMAPTEELELLAAKKIMSYDSIIGFHDLRVHNYGVSKVYASVHCEVPAEQDIMVSHDIIDQIERDFMKDWGIDLVIHLDPVVSGDEETNLIKADVLTAIADISPEIGMHDFRVVKGIHVTKLIFDLEIPYGFKWSEEEVVLMLEEVIGLMDVRYQAVILVDRK